MRTWMWLAILLPVTASAMTLDDLTEGKTVVGPKLGVEELKGKIVYVEFWGTH